jgi:hypothetical protein
MVHQLQVRPMGFDPSRNYGQELVERSSVIPQGYEADGRHLVMVVMPHLRHSDVELFPQCGD